MINQQEYKIDKVKITHIMAKIVRLQKEIVNLSPAEKLEVIEWMAQNHD